MKKNSRFKNSRWLEMCLAHVNVRDHISDWLGEQKVNFTASTPGYKFFYHRLNSHDLQKETVRSSIRVYFIAKIFQYLTGWDFNRVIKHPDWLHLASVGEFCIALMYLKNHVQDWKYGIEKEEEERENTRAQKEIWDQLNLYLNQKFPSSNIKFDLIDRLFRFYGIGMKLDETELTYENFLANKSPGDFLSSNGNKKEEADALKFAEVGYFANILQGYRKTRYGKLINDSFQQLYFARTHLMNGVFFQVFTEFLLESSGKTRQTADPILEFARCYGMCQQLVNDTCDYLPLPVSNNLTTISKLPEDTFSDIRRRLMTLPMISYFSKLPAEEECLIRKHYQALDGFPLHDLNNNAGQEKVLKRLLETKAISHSKSLICTFFKYAQKLDLDPENPATDLLFNMFCFVDENRFYQAYGTYKSKWEC